MSLQDTVIQQAPIARSRATRRERQHQLLALFAACLAAVLLLAAAIGAVPIPLVSAVFGGEGLSDLHRTVLQEIRFPRIVTAAFVGAALAVTGAALQGLFRNPLAEPQLIGVSGGAALGAVGMIVIGEQLSLPEWSVPYSLPLAAFLGASLVTACLYWFAAGRRQQGVAVLLLVGIAINAITAVGIGAFTYFSDDGQLRTLTFWTMGSFGGSSWEKALPAIVLISLALALLLAGARRLDLLQLGEAEARHVGVDVNGLKRLVVFS
ncbi:MAG: iron ABC transporter permease, partial [Pseudomonadota bacterium]